MRALKNPVEVEATQWFKNGDHPQDETRQCYALDTLKPFLSEGKVVRYYRRPDVKGPTECNDCGRIMHEHGWIDVPREDGYTVCPGDWIIRDEHGKIFPVKQDIFDKFYKLIDHPDNDLRKGCPQCETPHYGHYHCGVCGYQGASTIESSKHPCYIPEETKL